MVFRGAIGGAKAVCSSYHPSWREIPFAPGTFSGLFSSANQRDFAREERGGRKAARPFPAQHTVTQTANSALDNQRQLPRCRVLSKAMLMSMEALANLVAALHLAYFLFVAGGFTGILVGARKGWTWIYNPWFRIAHLFAVLIILAEDVFRFPCALNVLESTLRAAAANATAEPSAVSGMLDLFLRHTIPGWFLDAMYWTFGVELLLLVFLLPPAFSQEQLLFDRLKRFVKFA